MTLAHIDFETFSRADLPKVGHYRYAEDESTEILLCAYRMDGWDGVRLWSPAEGEEIPADLVEIFKNPQVIIVAFNAAFERAITANCLPQFDVPVTRWRCSMVDAMAAGLPGKLAHAGPAAGLPEEMFKQEGGTRLINRFCKPRKPTKNNPAVRWTPETSPAEWQMFKDYCRQDVIAETAIYDKLKNWHLPEDEQDLWELDQEINDHGIRVDIDLVHTAHSMGLAHRERLVEKAKALTGLDNPNSVKQLIDWLNDQPDFDPDEDAEVEDLRKKTVEKILGRGDLDEIVRQVLELRQQIAKSSLKKYDVLLRATCADGYIRGTMQFGGANRTGRWAGRLLQVQNLPQGMIEDLAELRLVRELVRRGEYETLCMMYGEDQIPNVLATLIRTCLIASPGNDLMAVDFSAIESVVTAWFADCQWRMDVFKTHGKIYEASAATAFGMRLDDILGHKKRTGKHHPIRKKGKVIELACLSRYTQVLTSNGWVPLDRVCLAHWLWDGVDWVRHQGVVPRGKRPVIMLGEGSSTTLGVLQTGGIVCTPDHKFLVEGEWREAQTLPHIDLAEYGDTEVFDILEAGPRNCFTVRGDNCKEMISHNCGYGGGENAMINMGALEQGLVREELKPMVEAWRDASPEIAGTKNARGYREGGIWATLEKAAKECIQSQKRQEAGKCIFRYAGGKLVITLPSGRHLHYVRCRLERDDKGREQITYWGTDQRTKRWGKQKTWGGKLLENIVQAFSRDCLAVLMRKLRDRGYPQVMLVHDEDVMDVPKDFGSLEEVLGLMKEPIEWAPGLPLKGAGYRNDFYFKD